MKNKQYRGRAVRDYKSIGVKKGNWVYGYYWTNEAGNHFIRVTKLPSKIVLGNRARILPISMGR